ncbi:HIT-like domain-containing protein [Scleroderma yunnanense]
MEFDPTNHPHRRYNPLTNVYILVSPHRTKRPWLGQTEPTASSDSPQYDLSCYLCPGNIRAGGVKNDDYEHTMVFENDYPAILPHPGPAAPSAPHPLLAAQSIQGACDVVCFHPRHDLSLPTLSLDDVVRIVEEWTRVYTRRGTQSGIEYVQIFENKGAMMGCSNPHPHSQVWSLSTIPTLPTKELANLRNYAEGTPVTTDAPKGPGNKPCLLCEYVHHELSVPEPERIVVKNDHFAALVPWWAYWPFEIMILPHKRHISSLVHLTEEEIVAFADIMRRVTIRYDNLFACSFAYAMGIHQRPLPPRKANGAIEEDEQDIAHLHVHFEPPLLRSASVRKFMAGFEVMGEPQRDLTAEQAAQRLRDRSEVHYLTTLGAIQ